MREIERFEGTDRYLLDPDLAQKFVISRALQKPLLLEGEPGTGKTELAIQYAQHRGVQLYVFNCTSESEIAQLVSRYNSILHFRDQQWDAFNLEAEAKGWDRRLDLQGRSVERIDDYVTLMPLGQAYENPDSVLLLDEIDKVPRDFANSLLSYFSAREVIIPETGRVIRPDYMPTVVITSNREQDLPKPLKARCVYHFIAFPDAETMKKIVDLHHPEVDRKLVKAAIGVFYQLRELGLNSNLSTREMVEWIDCLNKAYSEIKPKELSQIPGDGVLFKSAEDLPMLETIRRSGLEMAVAQSRQSRHRY